MVALTFTKLQLNRLRLAGSRLGSITGTHLPFDGGHPVEQLLRNLGAGATMRLPNLRGTRLGPAHRVTATFHEPDITGLERAMQVMARAGFHIDAELIRPTRSQVSLDYYTAALGGHRLTYSEYRLHPEAELHRLFDDQQLLADIADLYQDASIAFPTVEHATSDDFRS